VLLAKGKDNMRNALGGMPSVPDEAYDEIITRIEQQESGSAETARQTLTWLYYARRPLEMDELREALAVKIGDRHHKENSNSAAAIIDCCLGLVTYEKSTGIIRFIHPSVRRWLDKRRGKLLTERKLAMTCLTYLNLEVFEEPCHNDASMRKHSDICKTCLTYSGLPRLEHSFASYASLFWMVHSRNVSDGIEDVMELIKELFSQNAEKVRRWLESYKDTGRCFVPEIGGNVGSLHVAAFTGIEQFVCVVLDKWGADVAATDSDKKTALHWASMCGHADVVKELLARKAKTSIDNLGRTALHYAAINGYANVAELLLKEMDNASIAVLDGIGKTALHHAVEYGHEKVVQLLAKNPDLIAETDQGGMTALHWAATFRHKEMVALLLEQMKKNPDLIAQVNSRDDGGRTPLSYAAENGNADVAKELLQAGAQVNSKNSKSFYPSPGWMPLLAAQSRGRLDEVQFVVKEAGSDVEGKFGRTPLSYAAENGHADVVQLLLDFKADVDSKDHERRTPLSYAAENGHADVAKLLLGAKPRGADVNSESNSGRTPLGWAKANRHEAVVTLLQSTGNGEGADDVENDDH